MRLLFMLPEKLAYILAKANVRTRAGGFIRRFVESRLIGGIDQVPAFPVAYVWVFSIQLALEDCIRHKTVVRRSHANSYSVNHYSFRCIER